MASPAQRVERIEARLGRIDYCIDRAKNTKPLTDKLKAQIETWGKEKAAREAELTFMSFKAGNG